MLTPFGPIENQMVRHYVNKKNIYRLENNFYCVKIPLYFILTC